ncbi:MAG: M1 family aminopeptidase, partial [Pyrinomonadaceae bacterium]
KDEDSDFGVVLPVAGEVGKSYQLTVEYSGDGALLDAGGGNFFLLPRSTWYPNNASAAFGDRALFDLKFHYPKGYILIGVGALVEPERPEGDSIASHWTSGQIELQVAGFNYGRFKKNEEMDVPSGYNIEYYANTELPNEVRMMQLQIEQAEARGETTGTTLGAMTTTAMAKTAIGETENAMRIYNAYFGKLPFTRIAMSQQPAGFFGQAWPTLVFMPYTAFLDSTQRVQMFGIRGGTNNFWTFVGPHEVSHQWWGHAVGWTSYHDQWMSEGFAEFSTSIYAQFVKKDLGKFNDLWTRQRELITETNPRTGKKPYTVGPVTQGYRLNSAKTGNVARAMIYPKGAYILQMIRMMMLDHRDGTGDKQFILMMKDFVQSHLNQDASTEDFKAIVEKYMTPGMDVDKNKSMNWFFDEWVYGTDVPAY